MFQKYHEAATFIESFSNSSLRKNFGKTKKSPRFFLDRTKYFLKLLGNPGKNLKYIHVTGTAGKGTVSTMLQEMLVVSGKKTGLFTSPYVVTSIDKIRVNDLFIAPSRFVRLTEYLKPFIKKAEKGPFGAPSAFEINLAIALLYFAQEKCEWVVLEVGLGGRYDATNVIAHPKVTVITNIDYDHTEILGDTLREIATDKAGIVKKGSAFFTAEQRPVLQRLFKNICKERGAAFTALPRQKNYHAYNSELVRAIGTHLGISTRTIEKGIKNTVLPCRFETIQKKPLVILDGAHNRAKIRSTISKIKSLTFRKLFVIASIAANKRDNRAILKPLVQIPYPLHIVMTRVAVGERKTLFPDVLLPLIRKYKRKGVTVEVIRDAHKALKHTIGLATKKDVILVTGSFFLAGELRKHWISEETVLRKRKIR